MLCPYAQKIWDCEGIALGQIVGILDLEDAIEKELEAYEAGVSKAVKDGVAKTAKQVNQTIKEHVTFGGTGEYVKAFRLSRTIETPYQRSYTWYVAAPYYRLTHLLENGHAIPWGGRSRAFPHIKYGEELAESNMLEIAKEAAQSEY